MAKSHKTCMEQAEIIDTFGTYQELFDILEKSKCFDHLIKSKISSLRCLLQPINGPLKFAYFTSVLRINKTFRLHHVQLFLIVSFKDRGFHIHLAYFIIIIGRNC